MNFGDILNKWEKQNTENTAYDKDTRRDKAAATGRKPAGERRSRLLRKKPDDFIDLHGLNKDEAWLALENFFENSRKSGHEKVLIIHGKGNHSDESALRDHSRRFIESCSFAGESGYSPAREGGMGATWVLLKETQR